MGQGVRRDGGQEELEGQGARETEGQDIWDRGT